MKSGHILLVAVCLLVGGRLSAQQALYPKLFNTSDVTLLDGPFKHARDLNIEVLLQYDVDRMLAPILNETGLKPKAEYYPNWEGLDGHIIGHYLSAVAMNYAQTGDKRLGKTLDYMMKELQACADASRVNCQGWGEGYLGGVPNSKEIWSTLKDGDFKLYKGAWVPFYNVHKMFAGLRDVWMYTGSSKAKKLFLDFCDWAIFITSGLSDEQMADVLATEQGGMNEVLADAYAITHDSKYMTAAKKFSHKAIMDPLSRDVDQLDNLHANTQVPKAVGFARIGELDPSLTNYHEAGRFFWKTVTENRSLAFGGNSRREHFPSPSACMDFITDVQGPESCNTYNMLKLTEALFRIEPRAEYADFYERAMFNHILSTQHPEHGGYVYFTPARPRHYRVYSAPGMGMWCCVGSGMENHGKYNEFIYTKDGNKLYVNLFVASELYWREKDFVIRQETSFPYKASTKFTVTNGKGRIALHLRCPSWCTNPVVRVNGEVVPVIVNPGSYLVLDTKWKKGDVIEMFLPMHTEVETVPNVKDYVAFVHGPILLGMKTGTEDMKNLVADDGRWSHIASGEQLPIAQAPILVSQEGKSLAQSLKPVPGKPLHFTFDTKVVNGIAGELEPFSGIHDSRYQIYWLGLDENRYKAYSDKLAKEEAVRLALVRRSYDAVAPGEQQPEADHLMKQERTQTGVTNDIFYRDARMGGFFSYVLATQGADNASLYVKYFGGEQRGQRRFQIYVDDELLADVDNTARAEGQEFYGEEYPVPALMLKGRKEVRVRFQSLQEPGTSIGGVYEVRLVRP